MSPSPRAVAVAALVCVALLGAASARHPGEQIDPPADTSFASWQAWLASNTAARAATRKANNLNGSIFEQPAIEWAQTAYIQPQSHPYDQYFYDIGTHSYTIGRYLKDLNTRYGGIDAVLVWPTYTNIGIDDRNQYDLFRALPGGLDGVAGFTKSLKDAGVRVLWPYNPWDQGTRYEGTDDATALATLLKQTNGDGFNGDTMGMIPENFYTDSVADGHPIALEPEGGGDAASQAWDTMGWGYWTYQFMPPADHWKWVQPRHLTNVCERWAKNHTDGLQHAFFNGDGFESWENVWGTWNGITPRDGEAIRRVGAMSRFLGAAGFLQSEGWQPYYPMAKAGAGVFASHWPLPSGERAWTIVNRGGMDVSGAQIVVNVSTAALKASRNGAAASMQFVDAYHGTVLKPSVVATDDDAGTSSVSLSFAIEGSGFGAIVMTSNDTSATSTLGKYLATMAAMTATPLASYSWTWTYLLQHLHEEPPTYASVRASSHAAAAAAAAAPPAGTVMLPGGLYRYAVSGVEIEGDDGHGVDVQFPWEPFPRREHDQFMTVPPLYMDQFPVTCTNYSAYLAATGYTPTDPYNWLKKWQNTSAAEAGNAAGKVPPAGYENKPVAYVSLAEARAYCAWAGGRLPQDYEWQYAAQGGEYGRTWPWGSDNDTSLYPWPPSSARTIPGPEDVDKFGPQSYSPFQVAGLVGNVWQYTSEFSDDHTRAVLTRGSANYRPAGSMWYYPTAYMNGQHNKYFLMDDSYERAGTLGFRCVADVDTGAWPQAACSKPVCGTVDPPNAFTDLEAMGSADWAQWGFRAQAGGSTLDAEHKAGTATPAISEVHAVPDSTQLHSYGDSPTAFSWTNGAPDANVVNTTAGIYQDGGTGRGFQFFVNADPGRRATLRVFAGAWGGAAGTFNATLASAPGAAPYVETRIVSDPSAALSMPMNVQFTVSFAAPAAAPSLRGGEGGSGELVVTWVNSNNQGNVVLQAAALSYDDDE